MPVTFEAAPRSALAHGSYGSIVRQSRIVQLSPPGECWTMAVTGSALYAS